MSDSSNTQKIVFGALAAAAGVVLLGYLFRSSTRSRSLSSAKKSHEKPSSDNTTSETVSKDDAANYAQAQELKEKGNQAFKVGKFQEAINFYTEGIKLTKTDQHVLYSNRSAAFAANGDYKQAIEDAQKCIDINPSWSKGYFRLGKAFLTALDYDKAYINFLKGIKLDPKNDELRKIIEQTKTELGPGDLDTRLTVDNNMIKLYYKQVLEELCNTKIQVKYEVIKSVVQDALAAKNTADLSSNEHVKKGLEHDKAATYRVLTQLLLEEGKGEEALRFAELAYEANQNDPQILQLLASAMLRSPQTDVIKPLEIVKKAIEIDPKDATVAHTFASIVLRYTSMYQPGAYSLPAPKIDTRGVLKSLKMALANPEANALLIADSGIRLWFKLFEDPEIQRMLMQEEQENMQSGKSPFEAYIKGLTNGAFSLLCLEPFFMESLSQIVFNNPALERVLSPFRTAFSSIDVNHSSTFNQLSPLIYAMALQCFRNNFSWTTTPEDESFLKSHQESLAKLLKEKTIDSLVQNGVLDQQLKHHLAIISLYCPLSSIDDDSVLYEVATRVVPKTNNNAKSGKEEESKGDIHPWLAAVLKKSLIDPHKEEEIMGTIKPLTNIPDTKIIEYYNSHLGTIWDNAGFAAGRMVKITTKQELEWIFPQYKPNGFDKGPVKLLIAGSSSGAEVMQAATIYADVDITAVDVSIANLAYAIRQNNELGIKAKFHLADIPQLDPSHFGNQLFDVIAAHGILNHAADPLKTWEKLAGLLRPGGIMRISLYNRKFLEFVAKCRKILSDKFSPPIFDKSTPLPKVLRSASIEEIRSARNILLENEQDAELQEEILMVPSFYSLNEFTDLLFHPQILTFSFTTIGNCLERIGLKLIGFEFPSILQETILKYRVDYPDDPNLLNVKNLEQFEDNNPTSFKNFAQSIIFACEKPARK